MAQETTAPHLRAVPNEAVQETNERRTFAVIEGFDFASRVVRFLSTTLLVTFMIGLVGALVLHATIIENQRDLDQRRADISRIAGETEAMRSQLATLEAPARIVREARELGMIEAPSIVYLTTPAEELSNQTLRIAASQLQVNE